MAIKRCNANRTLQNCVRANNVAAGARVTVRAARREPNAGRNNITDGAAPNAVEAKFIVGMFQKVVVRSLSEYLPAEY